MSIQYCTACDRRFDSDLHEQCPTCELLDQELLRRARALYAAVTPVMTRFEDMSVDEWMVIHRAWVDASPLANLVPEVAPR